MPEFVSVVSRVFECCLLICLGYGLRSSDLFKATDGETAFKLATYVTLPAVILQTLCGSRSELTSASWAAAGFAAVTSGLVVVGGWLYHKARNNRERALLAGCGVGNSVTILGYPLVEAVWGAAGLTAVVLVDLVNTINVFITSCIIFSTAGAAFPDSYNHADGGTYRGEWRGLKHEGLGVYSYGSGARYEGEWRDNMKEGRGVYYFPKGGVYEGEWSSGSMNGVGVRTLTTGKVKAGRWKNGQLETPLELWQCAAAAESAAEAALAARRVKVGAGGWKDGLQLLAAYPPAWAMLVGLTLAAAHIPLPVQADEVTRTLAAANRPLLLLALGLTISTTLPQARQVKDIVAVLGLRYVVVLFVGAQMLTSIGASHPATVLPITVAIAAGLCPLAPQLRDYAAQLRLSGTWLEAASNTSTWLAAPLLCMLGLVAAASGWAGPATAAAGSVLPLVLTSLALGLACMGACAWLTDRYDSDRRLLMVYQGAGAALTELQGMAGARKQAVQSALETLQDMNPGATPSAGSAAPGSGSTAPAQGEQPGNGPQTPPPPPPPSSTRPQALAQRQRHNQLAPVPCKSSRHNMWQQHGAHVRRATHAVRQARPHLHAPCR